MVIPVQSDCWDQVGTNGPESLLSGQLWPWGGGLSPWQPWQLRKHVGEAGQKNGLTREL